MGLSAKLAPMDEMSDYDKERAPVYDRVHGYPERQADLCFLEGHLQAMFWGGKGFWKSQRVPATGHNLLVVCEINSCHRQGSCFG
jgi:hypothetical protein